MSFEWQNPLPGIVSSCTAPADRTSRSWTASRRTLRKERCARSRHYGRRSGSGDHRLPSLHGVPAKHEQSRDSAALDNEKGFACWGVCGGMSWTSNQEGRPLPSCMALVVEAFAALGPGQRALRDSAHLFSGLRALRQSIRGFLGAGQKSRTDSG